MSQKKPKKILLAGVGQTMAQATTAALTKVGVTKVVKADNKSETQWPAKTYHNIGNQNGRWSGPATKSIPKKQLTKEEQEELGPICRQPFENRKKNPARFNKKKKF